MPALLPLSDRAKRRELVNALALAVPLRDDARSGIGPGMDDADVVAAAPAQRVPWADSKRWPSAPHPAPIRAFADVFFAWTIMGLGLSGCPAAVIFLVTEHYDFFYAALSSVVLALGLAMLRGGALDDTNRVLYMPEPRLTFKTDPCRRLGWATFNVYDGPAGTRLDVAATTRAIEVLDEALCRDARRVTPRNEVAYREVLGLLADAYLSAGVSAGLGGCRLDAAPEGIVHARPKRERRGSRVGVAYAVAIVLFLGVMAPVGIAAWTP